MNKRYLIFLLGTLLLPLFQAVAKDYADYCTETVLEQIYRNDSLVKAGDVQNLNFVIDIRYEEFQMVDKLNGIAQLNDRLKAYYTSGYNPNLSTDTKVGIYVILLSKQPPLTATDTYGLESKEELLALVNKYDKAKYQQYMADKKNTTLAGYGGLKQYDDVWVQLCENIQKKLKEKQSITFNNNKGAVLNVTNFVTGRNEQGYPTIGRNASMLFGKKLSNEAMLTVLKQTNDYLVGKKPSEYMPLYNTIGDYGFINLFLSGIEAGLNGIKTNPKLPSGANALADETGINAENGMVRYPTTGVNFGNIKTAYDNKWKGPENEKPVGTEKAYKGNSLIKYTDHAGILLSDPTFLDRFFKLQDLSGFSLDELKTQLPKGVLFDDKISYKIIITSKESFDIKEIPTAIQQAAQAKVNNEDVVYIGLHIDFPNDDNVQVYTTCTDKLLQKLKDYRQNLGYAWYENKTTGRIVFAYRLQYVLPNFYNEWNWKGTNVATDDKGQKVYNNYSDHHGVYLVKKTYVEKAKAMDAYLESDEFAYIFMEGYAAVLLAPLTGGASLEAFAVRRMATKITKDVVVGITCTILGKSVMDYLTDDKILTFEQSVTQALQTTTIQEYSNSIIDEFLEGKPIPQMVNACIGSVHTEVLKNPNLDLSGQLGACGKATALKIVFLWVGKSSSTIFTKLKAKISANPKLFVDKLKSLGYEVNEKNLADIQEAFDLDFDLLSILGKSMKELFVPAKLAVNFKVNLSGFACNTSDAFIDLVVHSDNGAYKAIVEQGSTYLEKALSTQDLADLINTLPAGKAVRLLSCNDLSSAKDISKLINGRTLIASDGWVDMFQDGTLASENAFKKLVNGVETETIAKYSSASDKAKVRLGEDAKVSVSALDNLVNLMKADFPKAWKFNKINDDAYEILDGTGKKWGTLYKDKIEAPARVTSGTAGNPILNKVPLIKNFIYEVDGFIYHTDDMGRVVKTVADLDDIVRVRLGNQQIRAIDVKDGVRGTDQGGHIIASRFFGPGEQINMYPMVDKLNLGAWKQMETSWADAMVEKKDVIVNIEAVFNGTSKRPEAFEVSYWIDGIKSIRTFINQ